MDLKAESAALSAAKGHSLSVFHTLTFTAPAISDTLRLCYLCLHHSVFLSVLHTHIYKTAQDLDHERNVKPVPDLPVF